LELKGAGGFCKESGYITGACTQSGPPPMSVCFHPVHGEDAGGLQDRKHTNADLGSDITGELSAVGFRWLFFTALEKLA